MFKQLDVLISTRHTASRACPSLARPPVYRVAGDRKCTHFPARCRWRLLRRVSGIAMASYDGAASFDAAFKDIAAGGSLRWKQGELVKDWETQHSNIVQFVDPAKADSPPRVLVPLAGDCAFVKYGWDQGFDVTAVEWCVALLPASCNRGCVSQRYIPATDTLFAMGWARPWRQ